MTTLKDITECQIPTKIKRLNLNTENSCKNCAEHKAIILKEVADLKDEIKKQNKAIMQALAQQTILIKSLEQQQMNSNSLMSFPTKSFPIKSFPINSDLSLSAIDEQINDDNISFYIDGLKSIMKGKAKKKLLAVLTQEIIIEYNVDGTHGKKRLKDFPQFYSVLKAAFLTEDDVLSPEVLIRKAMQSIKRQYFHSKCIEKKQFQQSY